MSISELLAALAERRVELWYEGDRLRFRAPKDALTPDERAGISARRDEVLAHLRAVAGATHTTFPLSFSQQSLWFLHQQSPDSTAYHIALSARVVGVVDVAALRHSFQAIVDRHAVLRTTYRVEEGAPVQYVLGHAVAALDVHDALDISDADLHARVLEDFRRRFDLEHGPVMRASLFSRAANEHVLLLNVHHIAIDGWSLFLLFQELGKLYAEAIGGPPAALARPECFYTDYARWQREMLAGPEGERLWSYWQQKLAPPRQALDLPTDHPRLTRPKVAGASAPVEIGARLTERLREVARQEGTTTFVLLLASYHAFLSRLTGAEDVIVGTPTFARSRSEFMSVVGDFVNSVAIRAALAPDVAFRDLVAQVRRTVHEALDAQELPLALAVQRLSPERDASRSPLFETFFTLQRFDQFRDFVALLVEDSSETIEFGDLRMSAYPLPQQEGQFDLALQMLERDDDIVGAFKYFTELFEESTVRALAADYVRVVEAIAADPNVRLRDLPASSVREARPTRASSNAASANTDAEIHAIIENLRSRDVVLFLDGDKLRVTAPKGVMTEEMKATIAERKEQIVAALRSSAAAANQGIPRVARDGRLPLSSAQRRLWFLDRMEPGGPRYNIGGAMRILGPLDVRLLRESVAILGNRHEAFRTRVRERDGDPEIEIVDSTLALDIVDVSAASVEQRLDEARHVIGEQLKRPFDLAAGPLARYHLMRLGPDDHVLGLSIHHIVADGWSLLILMNEIASTYDALAAARGARTVPNRIDYVDYAAWEAEQLDAGHMRPHLEYWKRELLGAPSALELPTDRPRPATPSPHGGRAQLHLDVALLEPLKQVGRQHDASFFMVLVAAFQVLLHRYSGQDEIVVGTPMANRRIPELEGIVGCFVNNLALRGRVGGNPTFAELLARTKQTVFGALEHGEVPFDLVVDAVRQDRVSAQAPLFQVLLTLHSFATKIPAPAGLSFELLTGDHDIGTARFDLALEIDEFEGRFSVLYEFSSDLFDRATIERMHGHFGEILRAVATNPATPVHALPLLSDADERVLLDDWNATAREHDRTRCVHTMLETAVRQTPEAIAVVAAHETLSFRELDARANQLARLLVRRGVTPGSLVAIALDRTADMPVAMAAVLKAGAAYVPLDPSHPADRLRYTLDDAGVACAITRTQFASLLGDAPLVLLDEVGAELAALPDSAPAVSVSASDRAYVIYTSGSTGRPKGVEVEHRNVVAFLEAMRREPGFTSRDALLAVTTLSFDIAGLEFWLPLTVGGRVVVASRADVLNGERLAELLDAHRVTVMQATPATWRLMLDAGWTGKRDLKVLCGGEALPRDLASELLPRVAELWNMYGPTETTIWSTVCRIENADAPITIGRPIDNTRIFILEPSGFPAPVGVTGELCIGGEGVARGYHNRPDLTAEKFVQLNLPGGRSERAYRTGDLARYRADGQIDFLGRRDQQVKVRGYRIELGEIEAVLATANGVKHCVVAVREDAPGDQRIVAYVVQVEGQSFDAEAAKTLLRERLPEYMIPSAFSIQAALPLTPNGKIDRKALPAPNAAPAAVVAAVSSAMMTPAQRRVAAVWRDVLRTDRVGLHDNFFDVGGHSLLLVRLHANLKREFETSMELVELFQWTTVAAQASRLTTTSPGAHGNALRRAQERAARQVND